MRFAGFYSLKNGRSVIEAEHDGEWREIANVIAGVDSSVYRTKLSREKTKQGRVLFSPPALNKAYKAGFYGHGWKTVRVNCDYSAEEYVSDYTYEPAQGAFREMDFVKNGVGVEVQFGKYAFMVYNVCAKMTIFRNLGHIQAGVEIVPMKDFAVQMSSGVSYFEQIVWDLKTRGESDIDIPVLVVGITS